ncbi:hypothetical protein Tco_1507396 [Tanacetum coccineum]
MSIKQQKNTTGAVDKVNGMMSGFHAEMQSSDAAADFAMIWEYPKSRKIPSASIPSRQLLFPALASRNIPADQSAERTTNLLVGQKDQQTFSVRTMWELLLRPQQVTLGGIHDHNFGGPRVMVDLVNPHGFTLNGSTRTVLKSDWLGNKEKHYDFVQIKGCNVKIGGGDGPSSINGPRIRNAMQIIRRAANLQRQEHEAKDVSLHDMVIVLNSAGVDSADWCIYWSVPSARIVDPAVKVILQIAFHLLVEVNLLMRKNPAVQINCFSGI